MTPERLHIAFGILAAFALFRLVLDIIIAVRKAREDEVFDSGCRGNTGTTK